MNSRGNQVLFALLLVQGIAIVAQYWPRDVSAALHRELLLEGTALDDVDRIVIEGPAAGDAESAALVRDGNGWRIGTSTGKRADETTISRELGQLLAMESAGVVSSTTKHHVDMHVSAAAFERKVTLKQKNGQERTIYLGNPGKGGSPYIRIDEDPRIFATRGVSVYGLSYSDEDWLDKHILAFEPSTITEIQLENENGVFNLNKAETGWHLNVDDEVMAADASKVEGFISQMSELKVDTFGSETQETAEEVAPAAGLELFAGTQSVAKATVRPGKEPDRFRLYGASGFGTVHRWRVDSLLSADVDTFRLAEKNPRGADDQQDVQKEQRGEK